MGELNLTYEEVKAYKKNVFEYVVDENYTIKFRMTDDQLEDFENDCKKQIDNRNNYWKNGVQEMVFNKCVPNLPKSIPFEIKWIDAIKEAVTEISNKLIEIAGLDKYKPKQKTIGEATKELRNEDKED